MIYTKSSPTPGWKSLSFTGTTLGLAYGQGTIAISPVLSFTTLLLSPIAAYQRLEMGRQWQLFNTLHPLDWQTGSHGHLIQ